MLSCRTLCVFVEMTLFPSSQVGRRESALALDSGLLDSGQAYLLECTAAERARWQQEARDGGSGQGERK